MPRRHQATLATARLLLVPLADEHLEGEVELGYRQLRRFWTFLRARCPSTA